MRLSGRGYGREEDEGTVRLEGVDMGEGEGLRGSGGYSEDIGIRGRVG